MASDTSRTVGLGLMLPGFPFGEVPNFFFCNGFSGHGLQQSPAMGRGIAELVVHGRYRTLDLSELGYERVIEGRPFLEKAVI